MGPHVIVAPAMSVPDKIEAPPAGAIVGAMAELRSATAVCHRRLVGGQTLLPFVERRLGMTAQADARYLASYGADVSTMWSRFGVSLESRCNDATRRALAVRAAVGTFEALEEWLCGAAPEP
jgi:hypothetical protein